MGSIPRLLPKKESCRREGASAGLLCDPAQESGASIECHLVLPWSNSRVPAWSRMKASIKERNFESLMQQ